MAARDAVRDDMWFRRLLWAAAAFNAFGACVLAVPQLAVGAWAGLPSDVPLLYRAIVASFVLLFGGAYAWLAGAKPIDRPMVAFGAIGKAGVFALSVALYLASAATARTVLLVGGDLAFAALFAVWLRATR